MSSFSPFAHEGHLAAASDRCCFFFAGADDHEDLGFGEGFLSAPDPMDEDDPFGLQSMGLDGP